MRLCPPRPHNNYKDCDIMICSLFFQNSNSYMCVCVCVYLLNIYFPTKINYYKLYVCVWLIKYYLLINEYVSCYLILLQIFRFFFCLCVKQQQQPQSIWKSDFYVLVPLCTYIWIYVLCVAFFYFYFIKIYCNSLLFYLNLHILYIS